MKTLLEVLRLSAGYLAEKGIPEAKRQAEWLLSDALGISRVDIYMRHDLPLSDTEIETVRARLKRRGAKEPLAYIHGKVSFAGCEFIITPDVLIPRQETEILAEKVSRELNACEARGVFLDLCTGSGCLGISVKKKHPQLTVILADLSEKALAIAKKNARLNEVSVEILQGDFLDPLQGRKVDFLICNPPYISESEYKDLDPEVKNFEPSLALVAKNNGLDFYERLSREAYLCLNPRAKLWLEIGAKQGQDVQNLFSDKKWVKNELEADWSGNPRFISLEHE